MSLRLPLWILVFCKLCFGYEIDPIIYTSKQSLKESELTSSSILLTKKQIESTSNFNAIDLLSSIPGVFIEQQGTIGGQSNIFIRGADSKHTLILIDGIKVFDPTSIGGKFELSILNTLDIERIEVLKGAQSVLYGSDAIGGVINIVTSKGSSKNIIEIGEGILKEIKTTSTKMYDQGTIMFSGFYQESNFDSDVIDTSEKDYKQSRGVSIAASFDLEAFTFDSTFKLNNSFSQVDQADQNGIPIDGPNAYQKLNNIFLSNKFSYEIDKHQRIEMVFGGSLSERVNKSESVFVADGEAGEVEARYIENKENNNLLIGLIYNFESAETTFNDKKSTESIEAYINNYTTYKAVILETGLRGLNNKDFGDHLIYSLGLNYNLLKNMKVGITSKNGFKAPSSFELYDPEYGNQSLTPEKSNSIELNLKYSHERIRIEGAIFRNTIENTIGSDSAFKSVNIDGYTANGIDLSTTYEMSDLFMSSNISLIDYRLSDGRKAQKKPSLLINLNFDRKLGNSSNLRLNYTYNSKRFEYTNRGSDEQILNSYSVFDAQYILKIKRFKIISQIRNIFDQKYETSFGYTTQRRGFQMNLQYNY